MAHVRIAPLPSPSPSPAPPPAPPPGLLPFSVLGCIVSIALLAPLAAVEKEKPSSSGALSVRVLGADGRPLDGARVEMRRDIQSDGLLEKASSEPLRTVGRPAGSGEYRFALPPPGARSGGSIVVELERNLRV